MAIDYLKLNDALRKAELCALNAQQSNDGGSCNLDTPMIVLPRANRKKLAELCVKLHDWGHSMFAVGVPLYGQGYCRTAMAEAAVESLRESGFRAYVHYCMD